MLYNIHLSTVGSRARVVDHAECSVAVCVHDQGHAAGDDGNGVEDVMACLGPLDCLSSSAVFCLVACGGYASVKLRAPVYYRTPEEGDGSHGGASGVGTVSVSYDESKNVTRGEFSPAGTGPGAVDGSLEKLKVRDFILDPFK